LSEELVSVVVSLVEMENGALDLKMAIKNCEGSIAFLLTLLQGMREEHAKQKLELQKYNSEADIAGLK